MTSDLEEMQRYIEAARAALVAKGIQPAAPEPELEGEVPTPTWTYDPIFQYLYSLQRLSRVALEAKFRKDVGEDPPVAAKRWWLIEKMARKFQREYLLEKRGDLPASVERNDREFARLRAPRLLEGEVDPDEPRDHEQLCAADMRLVVEGDNPFTGGWKWEIWEAIKLAGGGVNLKQLELILVRVLGFTVPKAEKRARSMFVKWTQRGVVRLA